MTGRSSRPSGERKSLSAEGKDPFERLFASPPDGAKPRVWWHWMDGNISREGIDKDLHWMKRIGVGGLHHFDGALDTPQVVPQRLIYMTPAWQDAFRHAVETADRLGLEFGIASSPGWSETGGPWVKPQDGMKKLVWSETCVPGGRPFSGALATPPDVSGPFQDVPMLDILTGQPLQGPRFYQDVAVIAYRRPSVFADDPKPVAMRTHRASLDAQAWLNGSPGEPLTLPLAEAEPTWILYDYGSVQRFRSVSIRCQVPFSLKSAVEFIIEASLDGERFEVMSRQSAAWHRPPGTLTFPGLTARYLRLRLVLVPAKPFFAFEFQANSPGALPASMFAHDISEVRLEELTFHSAARVHRFEEKAGFHIAPQYYGLEGLPNEPDEAIEPTDLIDLSGKMTSDGTLHWYPPPGDWTVQRQGFSLTGKTNHPASAEATGLEVDKLDQRAVKAYLDQYLSQFETAVGTNWMGDKGIRTLVTDSIESAGQNWTATLPAEFKARRGYDLTRWLPALTGVIISNTARTGRFLWDFRRTLIELIAEAHYGQIAASVHARGMLYYSESLEGHATATLGDDLDMRIPADIPMAALWTSYRLDEKDGISHHVIDCLGAASVAHVFGKTYVACESLTSANEPWVFSPRSLRPYIDLAFVLGINRVVIHTSVHQPSEQKPGMSLGCFGQHFTRHETWAEMAGPWISYLSRTSYLLQQGRFVADIAWFYGEDGGAANLVSSMALSDFPSRYGFDLISPRMLLEHLRAHEGQLVSEAGARYRLLFLGGSSPHMTLTVLRKLKNLVDGGVVIAGRRPTGSPSLADEGHEGEYRRLVSELWNDGRVIESHDPQAALHSLDVLPDFQYTTSQPDSHVRFLHRQLPDAEIYFVTNRKDKHHSIQAWLRVSGRRPELWHADTGTQEAVSWRVDGKHTVVSLELGPYQSVFVVLRERTDETVAELAAPRETPLICLDGPWDLRFEADRGAPTEARSTALGCWTESDEPNIRYFSGIGTYRKAFTLGECAFEPGERVILDLGVAHELAEVILNDVIVGTAWHAPYRMDVTDAVKPGVNTLEIRVANLWVNRLIGDQQPGAVPIAFTVTSTYQADAPLRPSGLIGPVALLRRA